VLDEVHVLPDRKLYDNLKSAANKVDGSMFVTISTAGFDMTPQAIGWQLYSRARDVLEKRADVPTLFAFIVEADRKTAEGKDADPFDLATITQANPNLGISVSVAGLLAAAQTAREVPSERVSFLTKHLGWWQSSGQKFIDLGRWKACARADLRLEEHADEPVTIGLDLAATRDLTARVAVHTWIRDDGKRAYRVFTRGRAYLPEKSPTVTPDLKRWADEGWLILTDGEVMDYVLLGVTSSRTASDTRFRGVLRPVVGAADRERARGGRHHHGRGAAGRADAIHAHEGA
jgi:phage terminase large subunit-like protein